MIRAVITNSDEGEPLKVYENSVQVFFAKAKRPIRICSGIDSIEIRIIYEDDEGIDHCCTMHPDAVDISPVNVPPEPEDDEVETIPQGDPEYRIEDESDCRIVLHRRLRWPPERKVREGRAARWPSSWTRSSGGTPGSRPFPIPYSNWAWHRISSA